MASKYELTISTEYVSNWTFVEAIRELFQNAIDNEITNPENEMYFNFSEEEGILRVGNKTSCLTLDTLLLGSSSKRDDTKTIGKHGEGYKIAFMVLLREGKKVTVYNYGSKEIWETKLVKSRRFANKLVPCIFVNKTAIWKKVPSHDLMIEIEGITAEEYSQIVESNLNLQEDLGKVFESEGKGRILLDKRYAGRVYVRGLYISSNINFMCGYDFAPDVINLDRDRKLIDSFDLSWQSSQLWNSIVSQSSADEARECALNFIENNAIDTRYIATVFPDRIHKELKNKALENFITTYGEDSVPVETQEELTYAMEQGRKPVMVKETLAKIIKGADSYEEVKVVVKPVKEELREWFESGVSEKLTDEEIAWFEKIMNRL